MRLGRRDWRASSEESGGGVVLDLGYSLVDRLLTVLPEPDSVELSISRFYEPMRQVESSATAVLNFDFGRTIVLHLDATAVAGERKRLVVRSKRQANLEQELYRMEARPDQNERMDYPKFALDDLAVAHLRDWRSELANQSIVLGTIERLYDHLLRGAEALRNFVVNREVSTDLTALSAWPVLTKTLESAILQQARTALSIYDASGVVGEFESRFSEFVGVANSLATSSGTAALYSLYHSSGLGPGDEVIVADYGFFATATPLVLLGATVVFVDCDARGGTSPEGVIAAITPRTRAVVVTHMWGDAANIAELTDICVEFGLLLFEAALMLMGQWSERPRSAVSAMVRPGAYSLEKLYGLREGGVFNR